MSAGLVRLSWRDTDRLAIAEGRRHDGHVILPRKRAEALVEWILGECDGRFIVSIEPWRPEVDVEAEDQTRPAVAGAGPLEDAAEAAAVVAAPTPLGKALAALAFVRGHLAAFVALGVVLLMAVLAILAIHLPSAEYRVYPVAILALASFFTGFFSPRPPALPNP